MGKELVLEYRTESRSGRKTEALEWRTVRIHHFRSTLFVKQDECEMNVGMPQKKIASQNRMVLLNKQM